MKKEIEQNIVELEKELEEITDWKSKYEFLRENYSKQLARDYKDITRVKNKAFKNVLKQKKTIMEKKIKELEKYLDRKRINLPDVQSDEEVVFVKDVIRYFKKQFKGERK